MTQYLYKRNGKYQVAIYKHHNSNNKKLIENGEARHIWTVHISKLYLADILKMFEVLEVKKNEEIENFDILQETLKLLANSKKGYIWELSCFEGFIDYKQKYHSYYRDAVELANDYKNLLIEC